MKQKKTAIILSILICMQVLHVQGARFDLVITPRVDKLMNETAFSKNNTPILSNTSEKTIEKILSNRPLDKIQGNNISAAPKKRLFVFSSNKTNTSINETDPKQTNKSTVHPMAQHAHNITNEIIENNAFIENISAETVIDLPVGIRKTIMGIDYILAVDSLVITPTHAYLVAYMSLDIPQIGKLAFAGKEIKFTQSGGFSGDVELQLIEAPNIPFGNEIQLNLNTEKTYAVFDCKGFKHLSIAGKFVFSENILIPDNDSCSQVTASFEAPIVTNWNDLLVSVDINPFQVNGLKDFSFNVTDAVLDFSDLKNPVGLKLPNIISTSYAGEANLWRGFSLNKLTVKLPSQFNEKNSRERREFQLYDLLIDETGFTGGFTLNNVLSIHHGCMANWAFSVDSLHVSLVSNQFTSAGLKGEILIPIFNDGTQSTEITQSSLTQYTAIINPGGDYVFSFTLNEFKEIPVWKAEANIYSSSLIKVEIVDGKFKPKAVLNGKMSIDTDKANIPKIEFEKLTITSETPYIFLGNIAFGTEQSKNKLSKFPVQITGISATNLDDNELKLDFDILLNLVGEQDGGFVAEGGFSITGETNENDGLLSFKYKSLSVDRLLVDIDGGGFKLNGFVEHFDKDPVYGNGYNGKLDAEFKPGLEVSAHALFGTNGDLRYWFADAMVVINNGIPVFPGFNIYGFGGGAYFHMNQTSDVSLTGSSPLGQSSSGITYVPDKSIRLGIKASVNVGATTKEAFNSNATFDILFNNHGGINRITFDGTAAIMTPPIALENAQIKERLGKAVKNAVDKRDELSKLSDRGSINANIFLDFDFTNDCIHGDFNVYANLAGGLIKGVGANNLAGQAIMHFSKKEWFIHVGQPDRDKRVGLDFLGIARFDSYFMVGTTIPGSPPPPEKVSAILGDIDMNYMSELNKIGDGSGFAFGASLSYDTGERTFLMFYGSFEAGMGFDLMLKNYGENVQCVGRAGSIGINGWYANGQAYAYFDGEIGIKVDLPFKSGKYKILSIGAAAVLQAKLPNPVWMKGTVGGKYNILGGLVKGNCAFEVTIGEECELVQTGSTVATLDIIADMTPQNEEKDVDVFSAPQVVFNMQVNKELEISDLNGGIKKYKIKLDQLQLLHHGIEVSGKPEWNENHDVVAFNSSEILPPKSELSFYCRVSFEELKNGRWETVFDNGEKVTEVKETIFITGEAPDYIPKKNVLYSYPIDQQLHLYPEESSSGYIQLIKGQGYLFSDNEWLIVAQYEADVQIEKPIDYDYQKRRVNFNIPAKLNANTVYNVKITGIPKNAEYEIDQNVKAKSNITSDKNNSDNTMEIKERYTEGNLDILEEKRIYFLKFKTSHFPTFTDKMNNMKKHADWIYPIYTGVHELGYTVKTSEVFDAFEIHGSENYSEMVRIEAVLSNNKYYNNYIFPLVYDGYPIEKKFHVTNRIPDKLGLPPIRANYIDQENLHLKLSPDQHVFEQNNPAISKVTFVYNLIHFYNADFIDLQTQIVNDLISYDITSPRKNEMICSILPVIQKGHYEIVVRYVLPDGKVTTEYPISIFNEVNFSNNGI